MQPPSKRRKKSLVWDFMEQVSPTSVRCIICKGTLTYSKTTSNMMKHIQTKHPLQYAAYKGETLADSPDAPAQAAALPGDCSECPESSQTSQTTTRSHVLQQTLHDVMAKKDGYKEGGFKKKNLDDLLTNMITTDLQPMSIVEDRGFRKFVHGLDPRYILPSRRDLTRKHIPNKYHEVVQQVKNELREIPHISLTTDIWTSRQTRGFLTVTAHYICANWNMKSAVLETARIKKDHTAENIAEELTRILKQWDILDKVYCIVTDNGANIVAAVNKYMQAKHLPCFAHTLNLVVQDAIKNTNEIKCVQEKIKRLVSFFHHSVKAMDKLSEMQEQNEVQKKKLIIDVDTRWNSTYYMMERFLEQHEVITTCLCLLGKNYMCLSEEELELVRDTVALLEPFEEATREMSSEKFTSLSKVIPITRALQECTKYTVDTRKNIQGLTFGGELQKQLQKRFPAVKILNVGAATLLDSRFKKVPFADMENVKTIEERLINLMRSKYSEEGLPESPPSESADSQTERKDLSENVQEKNKGSLWKIFDERAEKKKTSYTTCSGPHIEMRRYLEEPLLPREGDPLKWWKMHSALFPKLQGLVIMLLSIPATSVPAERLFSKAGELVSQRRSALSDDNINMILFLNKNIN
ncbi:hypothetical protein Pcinc_008051 [Petrolisthes cinctipes]|uniref:BED-type domain-containing protein n=1 Tax=Petrolisthes cinctipes TaxID=88211 RepID=A0AAE1KWB7_PETCI|nr:hypothetical protein Pcinc_008051 [Petrolisthes cinctipes]